MALLFLYLLMNKVYLRALEPKDIDNIYAWENDVEQWAVGINNRFISKYDIENYILTAQIQDAFTSQQIRFIIDVKEKEKIFSVGCVDVFDIDVKNLRASIGIYITPDCRKRGYALKAISLIENYTKKILCFNQLYALVGQNNTNSIKLFEKASFILVATLPQWLRRKNYFENVHIYQKIL